MAVAVPVPVAVALVGRQRGFGVGFGNGAVRGRGRSRGKGEEEEGSVRFEGPHVGHTDCVAAACLVGEFLRGFPRRLIVPARDAITT